jgi:hypothetical protein
LHTRFKKGQSGNPRMEMIGGEQREITKREAVVT